MNTNRYVKCKGYIDDLMVGRSIQSFNSLRDNEQNILLGLYMEEFPPNDLWDFLMRADRLEMLQELMSKLFTKGIEGRNELGRYLVLICRKQAIDFIDELIDEVRAYNRTCSADDQLMRGRYANSSY